MDEERKRLALHIMKRHGIIKVVGQFNGGGDSGSLDSIEVDGLTTELNKLPFPQDWTPGNCNWRGSKTLDDFVHEVAEELAVNVDYDWVNNDGGYGTVTIVPGHDYIFVDLNLYEMTSENVPLDLSLPEATSPPVEEDDSSGDGSGDGSEVTQQSNDNSLQAVITRLVCAGHITPSENDQLKHALLSSWLYEQQNEAISKKYEEERADREHEEAWNAVAAHANKGTVYNG